MRREASRHVALLALFLASGCSALIYEVVWFQQLSLVLGATAVSLAILLASFMGGMCLGSLGFSRFVSARHHPLRVYAVLELIIAICGVAVLWLIPATGQFYFHFALDGANDLIARMVLAMLILLPPTICMGASLPAVSRWVESSRSGIAWLGWFYGANTLGAVVGSLMAGMYLLRSYDVTTATFVAAAMNVAVAIVSFRLAAIDPVVSPVPDPLASRGPLDKSIIDSSVDAIGKTTRIASCGASSHGSEVRVVTNPPGLDVVCLSIGISGLTALGAEVVWTRYLGLLLGPTVYTFSIILSVFLLGLGIGSSIGSVVGRTVRSPRLALALSQLLLMAAIPYAAWMIIQVIPNWLILRGADEQFSARVARDIVRTFASLFPATCLWGASFPLAVASVAGRNCDTSRLVGRLYAANTFGAIIGSLAVSLIAFPYGGQFVQSLLTCFSGISGLLIVITMTWPAWNRIRGTHELMFPVHRSILGSMAVVIAAVGCFVAWRMVPVTPIALLAEGRYLNRWDSLAYYLYVAEGLDSPIVVSDLEDGTRCFHVAGKVEASTTERDVRTQRLLGHLPAMAHPGPKKVLVVGCGSGMTAGSFLLHPTVEQIVLCEMEKCVIEASRENFADYNYGVLFNPKTRVVHDDARHFLATTRDTFDIITTDPIHPWVKGAATLYTTEFFQLCKRHLNRDGIVTLWVPLYESSEATVKCEMATFLSAFPQATIWSGQSFHVGYDLVVVAAAHGQPIDAEAMAQKLNSNESLRRSFGEVGLGRVDGLLNSFVATGADIIPWLHDAQINRDCNLRLQYLAGTGFDNVLEQHIFQQMTASRDARESLAIPLIKVTSPEDL